MHLIAYISESLIPQGREDFEIEQIIESATAFNAAHDVTGVLFYRRRQFMQILEGDIKTLRALMNSITADRRHKNVQILADVVITNRDYTDWSMKLFNLETPRSFTEIDLQAVVDSFKRSRIPSSNSFLSFYETIMNETLPGKT